MNQPRYKANETANAWRQRMDALLHAHHLDARFHADPAFHVVFVHDVADPWRRYQPLEIRRVPAEPPCFDFPMTTVAHLRPAGRFLHGDPRIWFHYPDWIPVRIHQDPMNVKRDKFSLGADGKEYAAPRFHADVMALVNIWSRNLLDQRWHLATPLDLAAEARLLTGDSP